MDKKKLKSKIKYLSFSLLFAVIGSLPFFLFADYIKRVSAVGYLGLLLATILTNASILLPASGIAFTVSAATVMNPFFCVFVGGLGTTTGELVGYFCGKSGSSTIDNVELFQKIDVWLKKYGSVVVFIFALLPLPLFDFVGIAAGLSKMSLPKYIIACFLGKTLKLAVYVFLSKQLILL